MNTCHLCDRPRFASDACLCVDCDRDYQYSPESDRQYAAWNATRGLERPHPDPWWPIAQTAVMDYVRRVQAERRNGGVQ